jgi:hypothetical protein
MVVCPPVSVNIAAVAALGEALSRRAMRAAVRDREAGERDAQWLMANPILA